MEHYNSVVPKIWRFALVLTLSMMAVDAYGQLPPRRSHPLFVGKRLSPRSHLPCYSDTDCPETYCCASEGVCLHPRVYGELCLVRSTPSITYGFANGYQQQCGGCAEGLECQPITTSGIGRCKELRYRRALADSSAMDLKQLKSEDAED